MSSFNPVWLLLLGIPLCCRRPVGSFGPPHPLCPPHAPCRHTRPPPHPKPSVHTEMRDSATLSGGFF
jgi:hypothetical protein